MQNQNNGNWFLMGLLKVCLVGWAAVMFSKTSEVLTALAPVAIFGQTGLEVLYGIGTAALIEGVAVLLALLPVTHTNRNATVYTIILFGISTFCQFLDYSLVKQAATQSTTEAFFAWIALGIPSIGFGGLLLLLWTLTRNPEDLRAQRTSSFVGVVPTFQRFWFGKQENTGVSLNKDVRQLKAKSSKNGHENEEEESSLNPK